eukprot:scaffold39474_cov33-Tisochrysis_lutea.AAC.4
MTLWAEGRAEFRMHNKVQAEGARTAHLRDCNDCYILLHCSLDCLHEFLLVRRSVAGAIEREHEARHLRSMLDHRCNSTVVKA